MTTKQLDVKNRTYYFYNDLINVSNFEAGNLKIDKKKHGKTLEPSDWKVNSVNPFYLNVNKVFCFVGEKMV